MATAAEFIGACAAEVGHTRWNDEDADNIGTRYGRDYATRHGAVFGQNGVPFCDMGMTYCLRKVGVTDFDSAYVPARVNTARFRGWLVPYGSARPGDMVTVRVTHGAPHNLIADSARCGRELDPRAAAANEALKPGDRLWLDDGPALFQVRRTRAGDAWERRQAEACATPEPDTAPVSLGLPTLRVGAPI